MDYISLYYAFKAIEHLEHTWRIRLQMNNIQYLQINKVQNTIQIETGMKIFQIKREQKITKQNQTFIGRNEKRM